LGIVVVETLLYDKDEKGEVELSPTEQILPNQEKGVRDE